GVVADALFPRFTVHVDRNERTNGGVWRLMRKIRSPTLAALHLHLLARLHLNQALRSLAVLPIRLPPHFAAENGNIVIEHGRLCAAGKVVASASDFVRIVELIGAYARLDFEIAIMVVIALDQRAIGAGDFGFVGVRDGIADEVCRWIGGR